MTLPTPSEPITIQETQDSVTIQQLAYATWYPTYKSILSKEQIDFMLEEIYSLDALQKQIEEGQIFLLLTEGSTPAAFAAYSLLDEAQQLYKLNKLYIHPDHQGKGFGKFLLKEVSEKTKAIGGKKLQLNVHRNNPAKEFYLKHGFEISQIIDIPFGEYTLNDYILELNLL